VKYITLHETDIFLCLWDRASLYMKII